MLKPEAFYLMKKLEAPNINVYRFFQKKTLGFIKEGRGKITRGTT
jgi:hypothetical protein